MWDEEISKLNASIHYCYVRTVHFLHFIFQTNIAKYILIIYYIS